MFQSLKPGPHLRTPEQAAVFVLENLSGLTFEQIGDIEKNVGKFHRSQGRRHHVTSAVIYGCRVIKPTERMKSAEKIAARWGTAWCGIGHKDLPGVWTHGDERWISLCRKHWTPVVIAAVERALKCDAAAVAKALDGFYPEISR
jgi:hypothetical protein